MRKTLFGIIAIVVIIAAYLHLPLNIRRHKDIEMGEKLIRNIENYQKTYQKLPETNDYTILKQLSFHQNKQQEWQPMYQKLNTQHFQIIYNQGFEPPYLSWDNQNRVWQLSQ